MLTPDQLTAIRKRADAATPPLVVNVGKITIGKTPNGDLSTVIRGSTPVKDVSDWERDARALLDEVEWLKSENERMKAERLAIARIYDPNCDEYDFVDQKIIMDFARRQRAALTIQKGEGQ